MDRSHVSAYKIDQRQHFAVIYDYTSYDKKEFYRIGSNSNSAIILVQRKIASNTIRQNLNIFCPWLLVFNYQKNHESVRKCVFYTLMVINNVHVIF